MGLKNRCVELWDKYFSDFALFVLNVNVFWLISSFLAISYAGLTLCNEVAITANLVDFIWWSMVTSSTVGYGDIYPSTAEGKLFTALFVIPFGLSLFGLLITRIATKSASIWHRHLKGKHNVSSVGHIIIIGYSPSRTPSLVNQLLREIKDTQILLLSVVATENPMPGKVNFLNVSRFTNEEELKRANIDKASVIVVDNDEDDATLTNALFINSFNKTARIIAHFDDPVRARILEEHNPNAECIANLSTELVAKSVMDGGSSLVHKELVSAAHGQTQYSMQVPQGIKPFTVGDMFLSFKSDYEATIVAHGKEGNKGLRLNPPLSTVVQGGDVLHYVADERVEFDAWPTSVNEQKIGSVG